VGIEPPDDIPTIGPYPATIQPYHPKPPWYERWKLPRWFKKTLSAKKALGNTSIRAEAWAPDRYAISVHNPNWGQRAVRWIERKWTSWTGKEPPQVLKEVDHLLESGGPLADDAGEVLEGLGLKTGGGAHAETIQNAVRESVIEGAKSPKALGWAALLSVAQNVITYGFGSKKDIGLNSPEFFTSTVVDFGVNMMLGLITAGIVAVAVGGITVMGTTFALPVAAVGIASLGIGMLVVSPLFNSANRGLGHLISKDTNISFTEWIKKSWTQRIKDADREAPDISNIGFPDTPNGLAP
jgi:hypothetical protein